MSCTSVVPLALIERLRAASPRPRELAVQLAEQFRAFGAGMSLRDAVIIGGLDMHQQARELHRRPHVVIATPGRLAVSVAAWEGAGSRGVELMGHDADTGQLPDRDQVGCGRRGWRVK